MKKLWHRQLTVKQFAHYSIYIVGVPIILAITEDIIEDKGIITIMLAMITFLAFKTKWKHWLKHGSKGGTIRP